MDNLKEIFSNVKERVSNPLIFSFISSWLIINWQITISLFWYDTKQIEKTGCNSIFEFIYDKINTQDCLLTPFYMALIYTFLLPIIKIVVKGFNSWIDKWGDKWHLSITKDIKIPFQKYLKLRDDYNKRSELLEKIITKEEEYISKHNNISTELLEAKNLNNELTLKLFKSTDLHNELHNIQMLNGYWKYNYQDSIDLKFKGSEDILIEDGKIYSLEDLDKKKLSFNIHHFYYTSTNKKMFFVKEKDNLALRQIPKSNVAYIINSLTVKNEDLLVGIENNSVKVEYKRIP